jgi:hypothetical protein
MTWWRAATFGVLLVVSAGCGVKSVYNNLDRLLLWSVDDFIEMDARQEAFFKSRLGVFLYWHRTTQLPLYARGLERIEREVRDGLTLEELVSLETMVTGWAETLIVETVPFAAEMLHSLSDEQIAQLEKGFAKNNEKWLKPYSSLDLEARRKRWTKEYDDMLENFVGNLAPAQRDLIARFGARWEPDDATWLEYRQRWQADLVALVRKRLSLTEFELAFRDMSVNRERWYGEEYQRIFTANEAMYRALTIEVLASLDDRQKAELSKNLLAWAQDFDELVAESPPLAPPAACLVTC